MMMLFMSKTTLFCILFSLVFTETQAQTYYYKLIKKIEGESVYTNTAGGQFITFDNTVCFESDKYGYKVNESILHFDKERSKLYKIYIGVAYFGMHSKFKFTSDYRLLNIETEDGRIYVYKRCQAPSSVTTCSLIRKRGSSSGNSGSYSPSFPNNGYGGGYVPNKNGSSSSSRIQNTTPSRKQPTKHTCSLCNGQRRIVKNTYPSLYGQSDYQVKCNECGGYFMRSTGHTHITCPQCHGKGFFTTE